MAEVRNTFIKSKMNKDLDARILPAGEYRDAVNVTVSTSEGADVGALENILGNKLIGTFTPPTAIGVELIGVKEEPGKNRIFAFYTNYVDSSTDRLSNKAPKKAHCSIIVYNITSGETISLVSGSFLNFSKTHRIFGINVVEDLLFWTDNRNQPRKINIEKAIANPSNSIKPYYTIEENISVAKYYPFQAPEVYNQEEITVDVSTVSISWPGSVNLPNNYPQIEFNSKCTITSGTPTLKLHPGLKFELVSYTHTNPNVILQEFKNTYPYYNEIRNWPIQPYTGGTGNNSYGPNTTDIGWSQTPGNKNNPSGGYNQNRDVNLLEFYSNIPFYILDELDPSVKIAFQGTAVLRLLAEGSVNPKEQWLKPTYRLNGGARVLRVTSGQTNILKQVSQKVFDDQGAPGGQGIYQLPLPFQGGTGNPPYADPPNPPSSYALTDIQKSIGAYPVQLISNNSTMAYNIGNDLTGYYYRRFLAQMLQPGMRINNAAFVEDGSSYIIDQILISNGGYSTPGYTNENGFDNTDVAVTVRKIDADGEPILEWTWPVFLDTASGTTTGGMGKQFNFSFPNPYYEKNFVGNSATIEDKFCRLAYRFIYDNNETSLISPFTQPIFKPKQSGFYQINDTLAAFNESGDEFIGEGASPFSDMSKVGFDTTNFLYENDTCLVNLIINMPYIDNSQLQVGQIEEQLKIKSIEIIYSDSSSTNILALKNIPVSDQSILNNNSNLYIYKWDGDKPFKTLPTRESTRVSDQVPIRALSQEVSGNRVIYGNFLNRHSSPNSLDYSVGVSRKLNISDKFSANSTVEYPNHNLKQNREYQVGVVLSDRFGRQTDVILAPPKLSTDLSNNVIFSGDTIFNEFFNGDDIYEPITSNTGNIVNWVGDSLKMLWNSVIPSEITDLEGYPGIYTVSGSVKDFTFTSDANAFYVNSKNVSTTNVSSSGSGLTVDVVATPIIYDPATFLPVSGGEITAVSVNYSGKGYEAGDTVNINNLTSGAVLTTVTIESVNEENILGFYSYKIVVKQKMQDYYNIYMPVTLNGEPLLGKAATSTQGFDSIGTNTNALTTYSIIGDNVNKINAQVTESNSQVQYSSSKQKLFPRVSQFGTLWYDADLDGAGTADWKFSEETYYHGQVLLNGEHDEVVYIGNMEEIYNVAAREASDSILLDVYTSLVYKQPDNPYSVVQSNSPFRSSHIYYNKGVNTPTPVRSYSAVSDFYGRPVNTGVGLNFSNYSSSQPNLGIGMQDYTNGITGGTNLAVVEVEAFESLLDIYWETSTTGLIDRLNYDIANNSDENIPARFLTSSIDFNEFTTPLTDAYWLAGLTPVLPIEPTSAIDPFIMSIKPVNALNQSIPLSNIISLSMTVADENGSDVSSKFLISNAVQPSSTIYKIYLTDTPQVFLLDSSIRNFTCSITLVTSSSLPNGSNNTTTLFQDLFLENKTPVLVSAGSKTGITDIVSGVGGTFWGNDGTSATANASSPKYRNGSFVNIGAGTVGGVYARGAEIQTVQGLVWSIVSCIDITKPINDIALLCELGQGVNGFIRNLNDGVPLAIPLYVNENYFTVRSTAPAATYRLIYSVVDASGQGLTYTYPTSQNLSSLEFTIT